jgi:hypothetical protein
MGKSLLDKLGKGAKRIGRGIRNGVLVATAVTSLGFAGCNLCGPNPEPNHAPEITSTPTTTQVDEGSPYNYDVDAIDADGDTITYSLTQTPNWLHIDSNTGMISGIAPSVGEETHYNINVRVSDGQDTDTQNYSLTVKDIPLAPDNIDISGKLEDCENDERLPVGGVLKAYDTKNPDGSFSDFLGETSTDSNGNFSFTLEEKSVDPSDKIYLRAITGSSSSPTSYTRTIELSATDNNPITDPKGNPAVRVVPYDNPNKSYDDGLLYTDQKRLDFRDHMQRVNFGFRNGLAKWNHGELPDDALGDNYHPLFKGIQISDGFSLTMQQNIESAIRNSGYLKAGKINIVIGKDHASETGWGFIRPSTGGDAPGTMVYEQNGPYGISDGYIERFETNITNNWWSESKSLVNHEAFHGVLYPGHADSDPKLPNPLLALFNSIMKYTGVDTRYSPQERPAESTPADIKGNYVIDESTYKGMETKDNILGTSF